MNKKEIIELLTDELKSVIDDDKKEEAKEKILFLAEKLIESEQAFVKPNDNEEALRLFIDAKRIEGCSEKSLNYYRTTLQLVLKKINSENAVSFKGLEMKTNENKLPDSSFFLVLGEVMESLGDNNNYNFISTENTISTLSGKCKTSGNYEVQIYDSSGYIKEIKVPSKNLVISFSEFKENG